LKTLAVMKRELQENLRNYKTVFLLMFIFGAILMALYTEVGPTANSKSVLDPFFELFAVLCPMIGILTAMDAVVGEKEKGDQDKRLFGIFISSISHRYIYKHRGQHFDAG
jgi:ABC-type transport system involved in multi-copper enzyme maturation permease subunit